MSVQTEIIDYLKSRGSDRVTAREIAEGLGVSRNKITDNLNALYAFRKVNSNRNGGRGPRPYRYWLADESSSAI